MSCGGFDLSDDRWVSDSRAAAGLEFTKQMGIANCPTVRGVLLIRNIRLKNINERASVNRQHKPEELFNLNYLTKLDQSGFIDQLYQGK
jgi:hypothetical protein